MLMSVVNSFLGECCGERDNDSGDVGEEEESVHDSGNQPPFLGVLRLGVFVLKPSDVALQQALDLLDVALEGGVAAVHRGSVHPGAPVHTTPTPRPLPRRS